MYYSTAKAGLAGFDCAVHQDWHALFVATNPGTTISDNDSRVTLLNGVAITLHARLNGSSTLDWTAPAGSATGAGSTALLTQMHQATEQTLQGFMQFWTPFVDGSVVPANSSGLTVTHASTTFTLHAVGNGADVTEVFSNDLLLEHYDVILGNGRSVKFEPTYKATPQGLLVERFLAHLQQMGNPPGSEQEMRVGIDYQAIEGFPIPRQLNMEVVGTEIFNMSLDGCTVSRQ